VVALFATVVALSLGLIAMSGGGAAHRAFGTRLMWARVVLQALVVALLFIALLIR
jgi:hypothetical protein